MRICPAIVILLLVLSALGGAQRDKQGPSKEARKSKAEPTKSKLTTAQQRQVKQLLESAEAGLADLDPASRIVGLADLSQAYRVTDKAKAIDLLETALKSARDLQLDSGNRAAEQVQHNLEPPIIRDLATLAPELLDPMVDDMPTQIRRIALGALLPYYEKSNQLGRAYDLLMRTAQEDEMPYDVAASLMKALAPKHPEDVRSLFVSALSSIKTAI